MLITNNADGLNGTVLLAAAGPNVENTRCESLLLGRSVKAVHNTPISSLRRPPLPPPPSLFGASPRPGIPASPSPFGANPRGALPIAPSPFGARSAPPPAPMNAAGISSVQPGLGAKNPAATFKAVSIDPQVDLNPEKKTTPVWNAHDYVDLPKLSEIIGRVLDRPAQGIEIVSTTMAGLIAEKNRVMNEDTPCFTHVDEVAMNPVAWTSPHGTIYMATDAPEYGMALTDAAKGQEDVPLEQSERDSGVRRDREKIISTIVHESLHAASHEHVGFQAVTDTSAQNYNLDEYVTDYFAWQAYRELQGDGASYKTNYFTRDVGGNPKLWAGNLVEFLLQTGHASLEQIRDSYAGGASALPELAGDKLEAWKSYAKTGRDSPLGRYLKR